MRSGAVVTFGHSSSSQPGPDEALSLLQMNDPHFGKLGHVRIQLLFQIVCHEIKISRVIVRHRADKSA